MSVNIPLDIQSEIIKKLPIKSLLQFRSVSKHWKSLIDSSKFIKTYHVNHTNPNHHFLVRYKIDTVRTYTSIIDDNTFPEQKFPLTAPESLNLLRHALPLDSINGLLCFYGFYQGVDLETKMVVIWNPSVRKCVGIVIPDVLYLPDGITVIGFGVCCDTSDAKLVKINVVQMPSVCWEVQVFTLSSRVWKTVYIGAPFKSCDLVWGQVFVNGVIYWRVFDNIDLDEGFRSNFMISFDLKSERLGEVCLPERLIRTYNLWVAKVNESLGLLEYYDEGEVSVCGVWMRKDGENKPFTKIYTVKVEGEFVLNRILGFTNGGKVVMEMEDDDLEESRIEVYEPLSGRLNSAGISGKYATFSVMSYMETLLLLDQPNSIIH